VLAAAASVMFFYCRRHNADGNKTAKGSCVIAIAEKITALPRELLAVFAAFYMTPFHAILKVRAIVLSP